ncbi:MAG TPA: patatin-like phospholipase family protein [Pyrinomonadaceae bacterium]|nr:patatin-like phospholipase family protein [Pyrinomonadaceae bacterium]
MSQEEPAVPRACRRVHLVLSAGGVKCISYAGAVTKLKENGFDFASVSGSSAGSFIGAILCSRVGLEGFKRAASEFELSSLGQGKSLLPGLSLWRKPFAQYSESLVAERFREIVDSDPTFADLKTPFATFGVDLRTHKIHVYSRQATPEMRVADALRISTAAPFLFPAQEEGENILLDGALVSQSPVWLATAYNDELPIIVLRPKKNVAEPPPTGVFDYLASIIDLGGGSRDFYLMQQMPRVRLIEIDCGDTHFDQFHLDLERRNTLVGSGGVAVEAHLKDLLRTVPLTLPAVETNEPTTNSEDAGKAALDSLINALPPKRDQVFISYSHKDSDWLHRLQDALQPYTWNRSLNLWADTKIPSGADWNVEIRKALAAAKVAVLLVTINYLASDFIKQQELPEFIRASKEDGLTLLWVLVGPCGYKETALAGYQAVNNPQRPLKVMSEVEQDAELVRICEEISKALA